MQSSRPERSTTSALARLRLANRALRIVCLLFFFKAAPVALGVLHQDAARAGCACPADHTDPACPCPKCQGQLKAAQGGMDCHDKPAGDAAADPQQAVGARLASSCSLGGPHQATPLSVSADPVALATSILLPLQPEAALGLPGHVWIPIPVPARPPQRPS